MARTAQVNGTALMMGTMMVAMAMMVAAPSAGADETVTLEKSAYGPYAKQSLVVANSAGAWRQGMAALEAAGCLAVSPAPEPPTDVDWSREMVVMVSAGDSGYDVDVMVTRLGDGRTKVDANWMRMDGNDGGSSLPYHMIKLTKTHGLDDQTWTGAETAATLPLVGTDGQTLPAPLTTWGQVKAAYR
jgi:hypothetical protein